MPFCKLIYGRTFVIIALSVLEHYTEMILTISQNLAKISTRSGCFFMTHGFYTFLHSSSLDL